MKKLAFALVILALIVTFSPAAAATPRVPVGVQIDLTNPPNTFAAGAPFHIMHGFIAYAPWEDPAWHQGGGSGRGILDFALDVDGVPQKGSILVDTYTKWEEGFAIQIRTQLYNFPEGMTAGPHTFTGHWMVKCTGIWVNDPSCVDEISTKTVTILFE